MRACRLKLNNRVVAWAGVIGVGLLPCPDCGLPLAVKIWPVAALVGLFQWIKRRSARRLDLLLTDDLRDRISSPE
jgi:hypothetical protein